MIKKITHRIRASLENSLKNVIYDPPKPKDTVFLASSGRSGSTWLQTVITSADSFRILFEPFHSQKITQLSHWKYRQYLARETAHDEFYADARAILEGRVRHPWIDQDNRTRFPRKRFIKDIRANLFVAWLKRRFPHLKVIFLVRNPFSVAQSRIRLGWDADLNLFTSQTDLMARHFPEDDGFLASLTDPVVKQVAFWAVENLVALRELDAADALLVAYEDLVKFPEAESHRVLRHLQLPVPNSLQTLLQTPSRTSFKETASPSAGPTVSQIDESLRLLNRFKLDALYPDPTPKPPECFRRDVLAMYSTPEQSRAASAGRAGK